MEKKNQIENFNQL